MFHLISNLFFIKDTSNGKRNSVVEHLPTTVSFRLVLNIAQAFERYSQNTQSDPNSQSFVL